MKINPAEYAKYIGKKFVKATMIIIDKDNNMVPNIAEAPIEMEFTEIEKIVVKENKRNWEEKAIFTNQIAGVVTFTVGGFPAAYEREANRDKYVYFIRPDDFTYEAFATITMEYNGETEDEIRAILGEKVKEEYKEEYNRLKDTVDRMKVRLAEIERFII